MDRVYDFPGPSRQRTASRKLANLGKMENRGIPEFSHHPCKLVVPTSDSHNFPVRTPICAFLDSTESSLCLEYNKIKFSAKPWAE